MTMTWRNESQPHSGPPERLLGQILERTEQMLVWQRHILDWQRQIDWRLAHGDRTMDGLASHARALEARLAAHAETIETRLAALEARPVVTDRPAKAESLMPGWERMVKGATPYIILLVAGLLTGSADTALKILEALQGLPK